MAPNPQQQGRGVSAPAAKQAQAPVPAAEPKQPEAEPSDDPIVDLKAAFRVYLKKPSAPTRNAMMVQMDAYEDGFLERRIAALRSEFGK